MVQPCEAHITKEVCNEVCYASRIIEKGNESVIDTGVSVDGTWQM